MKKAFIFLILFSLAFSTTCIVYFSGIGCPHCAKTDPFLFKQFLNSNKDVVVIKYEVYHHQDNAQLMYKYNEVYNTPLGVPLLLFDEKNVLVGDAPIINNLYKFYSNLNGSKCLLPDGKVPFDELDLNSLPGSPTVWANGRVAFRQDKSFDSRAVKEILLSGNIVDILNKTNYTPVKPKDIELSGDIYSFENAVYIDGWVVEWNGPPYLSGEQVTTDSHSSYKLHLTVAKIISLAIVDAINPCALAVLTLMLLAILTYNPDNKMKVLYAGLAFSLAVFIIYFVYGLIIIKFFQIVQMLTSLRLLLYKLVALFAVVLGYLHVKDFINYKPGGFLTEMPMSLRPIVQKIINGITSPKGAFFTGAFVTLFLLPCTIGPYIIAGGILSFMDIIETFPWLALYNAVFVLPMLLITLIVYAGLAQVKNIKEWRDKNIKYIHLLSGIIMMALGIGMALGLI